MATTQDVKRVYKKDGKWIPGTFYRPDVDGSQNVGTFECIDKQKVEIKIPHVPSRNISGSISVLKKAVTKSGPPPSHSTLIEILIKGALRLLKITSPHPEFKTFQTKVTGDVTLETFATITRGTEAFDEQPAAAGIKDDDYKISLLIILAMIRFSHQSTSGFGTRYVETKNDELKSLITKMNPDGSWKGTSLLSSWINDIQANPLFLKIASVIDMLCLLSGEAEHKTYRFGSLISCYKDMGAWRTIAYWDSLAGTKGYFSGSYIFNVVAAKQFASMVFEEDQAWKDLKNPVSWAPYLRAWTDLPLKYSTSRNKELTVYINQVGVFFGEYRSLNSRMIERVTIESVRIAAFVARALDASSSLDIIMSEDQAAADKWEAIKKALGTSSGNRVLSPISTLREINEGKITSEILEYYRSIELIPSDRQNTLLARMKTIVQGSKAMPVSQDDDNESEMSE